MVTYGNADHMTEMWRRILFHKMANLRNMLNQKHMLAIYISTVDIYPDHPDYPEEVALFSSSRASSSPSVTSVDRPGILRIFDVFQDDPTEPEREYIHLHARPI
ncbi:hypothetical protein N7478_012202 [Penicillium angulare]|uniref:uncharacterized protein n=1 Tax=Penicillium angulare TaxID=116970 RepID=UPI0025412EB4|nr:uncharacterized protein N7478_012202 [Penicillium angulare]KAJ5259221.1 hypothetical protein N7478_012202 [Penicillium angulare]